MKTRKGVHLLGFLGMVALLLGPLAATWAQEPELLTEVLGPCSPEPMGAPATDREPITQTTGINADSWITERVDAPKMFECMGNRSLALDTAGHRHIAYGADHLYYAWSDGTTWHQEVVDASWGVGRYTSLALDASGWPHISYFDATHYELKYASFDGSGWTIEVVDGAYGYTSLALDESGHPHIAFHKSGQLHYAWYDGAAWQIEAVDVTGSGVYYASASIALDSSGQPHIAYYDPYNEELKYAWYDGTAWQVEVVDSEGVNVGWYASMALDASDHPHIAYRVGTQSQVDLRYTWSDGSTWHTEVVEAGLG